ncbi:MAG: nucleoside hydrolase [Anaerolineae bacterium]|nr:nucleoside hydrolase [Anaerolineae bacterium]
MMGFTRDPRNRRVPVIPPKDQSIRVIIDSDAKNEIDDQWAIALAILAPERFEIEGFIGANFDNASGGPDGITASVREIKTVLEKAGMKGTWPVLPGSHPMRYQYEPSPSVGVDFIIDRALASTPEDPLWVIGLGAATDIASAVLKAPEIIDRIVVFWHLRTRWPEICYNFNVFGDIHAARLLFHSPMPFVLFDTGTYLTCPMDESARQVAPYGALGAYLHQYRLTKPFFQDENKGFFDLGDIAALLDPEIACWEKTSCPEVGRDLRYHFKNTLGSILRCYHIDREATFSLLYEKLRSAYGIS